MMDDGHKWTDDQLEKLERRMAKDYTQAAKEMAEKQKKALKDFDKERIAREKAMDDTAEARKAHKQWLSGQANKQEWMQAMVDELAFSAHNANKLAMDSLNNALPHIYRKNAEFAASDVSKKAVSDPTFTLLDADTMRYLSNLTDQDQLIHEVITVGPPKRLLQSLRKDPDTAKDMRWNRQQFASAITQGILQGESIPNIVKRTTAIYGKNLAAATRAARTAVTGAENAGRTESYKRAEQLGINLIREWVATGDARTRDSHAAASGQQRSANEAFDIGGEKLMYPADPHGSPAETYNCRCTLRARVQGFDKDKLQGNIRPQEPKAVPASSVVNGQDILGTWQRRPDQFDFEIEDVLNAQGFDGLPRVVSPEEFDAAVKAANDGKGFIAQRTYSAPNQETLDSYRDQLYSGKWYVDCSTGGAQYGQGMYTAADYSGELSSGVKEEMRHYTKLGAYRNGELLSKDEYLARVKDDLEANGLWTADAKKYAENHRKLEKAASEHKTVNSLYKQRRELESALGKDTAARLRGIFDDHPVFSGQSYFETMTLDPSAKIITWRDAMKMMDNDWGPGYPGDVGAYAAAKGYDAINAEGHGASGSYTVILNRTKLIIRRPE